MTGKGYVFITEKLEEPLVAGLSKRLVFIIL